MVVRPRLRSSAAITLPTPQIRSIANGARKLASCPGGTTTRPSGFSSSDATFATNRFVAKVASELEKPDGLVVVPPGQEASFLAPLAIERIWGVGKVMAAELRSLGLTTIAQLQTYPRHALVQRFGRHGESLHELAFGRDASPVEPFAAAKSMGAENTFPVDCRDASTLATTLREQAERVARELRAEHLAAARITLKLRYADFHTITRAWTGEPTQD